MKNFIQDSDFPKYEEYADCMVAFIDMLGFASKVKNIQTQEDFMEVGRLLYALKETEKKFNEEKKLFKNLTIKGCCNNSDKSNKISKLPGNAF